MCKLRRFVVRDSTTSLAVETVIQMLAILAAPRIVDVFAILTIDRRVAAFAALAPQTILTRRDVLTVDVIGRP